MPTIESTLKTTAIFSDDNKHRILLRKSWDSDKPKSVIIMLYPCSESIYITDMTTMFVLNNTARLGYGSIDILNLFSKTTPNFTLKLEELNIPDNDKQLLESVESCDNCVIAWGKGSAARKIVQQRQNQVLNLLSPFRDKLVTTEDERGVRGLHPLVPSLRSGWKLVEFEFPELKAEEPTAQDTGKNKGKKSKKLSSQSAQGDANGKLLEKSQSTESIVPDKQVV